MKRLLSIFLLLLFLCGCSAGVNKPAIDGEAATTAAAITATEPTQVTTEETAGTNTEPENTETTTEAVSAGFDPYAIIDEMSVEALVGQMFLARCPSGAAALEHIASYQLGGYILFWQDFDGQTPDSMLATIEAYQNAASIPMLIAVDEEGGTVNRVSSNSAFRAEPFPSPRKLYTEGGMQMLMQTELEKCQLLTSIGINVNMAPVCDVTTDPEAFMYQRSLGQSPVVTGEYIRSVVTLMDRNQLGSVLKHFPGYGNNTDTHVGIATDDRSIQQLESCDLIPFAAGIMAGCDAILVSHTFVNALDTKMPASLSPAVMDYLRNQLRFDGVIVTDDLVMQAITDQYGAGQAAVLAVQAGNDLLCSSEYPAQYAAVLEAVQAGQIPLEQVKDSVARILLWKHDLGLL